MINTAKQVTSILFRCDGSPEIGFGHIVRCLALADELHDVHNCRITFATRTDPLGIQMVEEKGYQVLTSEENDQSFSYREWLNECVKNVEAKAIMLDVRDRLPQTALNNLRNKGILVATIDDPEDKRLSADLAFYPPVPQVKRVDWTGFTGKLYIGWEWVILRKEFARAPCLLPYAPSSKLYAPCTKIPRILVTMGGSDPQGMTIETIRALEMLDDNFEAVVVLGAGFEHRKELGNLLSGCKHHFDVRENVQNMAELMAQCDLAVASFGVTAYELAAMSIPAIYLCLTEDHAESASAFVEESMAVCLGEYTQVSQVMLAEAVTRSLADACGRKQIAKRARQQVDGKGVERIAHVVANYLMANHVKGES